MQHVERVHINGHYVYMAGIWRAENRIIWRTPYRTKYIHMYAKRVCGIIQKHNECLFMCGSDGWCCVRISMAFSKPHHTSRVNSNLFIFIIINYCVAFLYGIWWLSFCLSVYTSSDSICWTQIKKCWNLKWKLFRSISLSFWFCDAKYSVKNEWICAVIIYIADRQLRISHYLQ